MAKNRIPDKELMALLQHDRKQAFTLLYQQYAPLLYGFILRKVKEQALANDILSDSMTEIWRKIDRFNAAKSNLYLWMMDITRNNLCHILKEQQIADEDCSSFDLVLYKTLNCKEAAEQAGSTEQAIKMDLRKTLQTVKYKH